MPLAEAYYILSAIRDKFGGTHKAPRALMVSSPVLAKLGELTQEGGPHEARKAGGRPLTDAERAWVAGVMPKLVHRVIEIESGQTELRQLGMEDLPAIP